MDATTTAPAVVALVGSCSECQAPIWRNTDRSLVDTTGRPHVQHHNGHWMREWMLVANPDGPLPVDPDAAADDAAAHRAERSYLGQL